MSVSYVVLSLGLYKVRFSQPRNMLRLSKSVPVAYVVTTVSARENGVFIHRFVKYPPTKLPKLNDTMLTTPVMSMLSTST